MQESLQILFKHLPHQTIYMLLESIIKLNVRFYGKQLSMEMSFI